MSDETNQQFNEALHLLDAGEPARAEETLRAVIAAAESEADPEAEVRGRVVLADLLVEAGRGEEAAPLLKQALATAVEDDLVDVERARASELLARLAGVTPTTETGSGAGGAGSW